MKQITKSTPIIMFILSLSIGLSSCREEISVPNENFKKLFGSWEWVSSGLYNNNTGIVTAESANSTTTLEYKDNGIYTVYIDGKKKTKASFQLEEQENNSPSKTPVITYSDVTRGSVRFKTHYFHFKGNDTLVINMNCRDCPTDNTYVRKQ